MIILTVLGSILGVVIAYLVVVIFFPIMKVDRQSFVKNISDGHKDIPQCREDISFIVNDEKVRGWIYLPSTEQKKIPCIVLSHGLGGTKDMALEKYALRFVEAGYAALTYDYRHYGESEGNPRQIYSATEQLDDLRAAIEYARNREGIDADKIILWGTSAGANYGIIIASEDKNIQAIIAQCGAFDHKEDSKLGLEKEGLGFYLRLFVHAQRDKGRSRFGLSRHIIPTYGRPGSFAFLRGAGVYEGVEHLAKDSKYFSNDICAAFMVTPHAPNSLLLAKNVQCQTLILVCENDGIVSPKSHLKLVEILGEKAEVKLYPIGHFDIYFDQDFEKAVGDQITFIRRILS